MTERRRPRRPSSAPVVWASLLLFATLFALLTYNLSAAQPATREASAPRVRKIIKRRVVTTVIPSPGTTSVTGSTSGTSTEAAPVEPVPEPVVTSAS